MGSAECPTPTLQQQSVTMTSLPAPPPPPSISYQVSAYTGIGGWTELGHHDDGGGNGNDVDDDDGNSRLEYDADLDFDRHLAPLAPPFEFPVVPGFVPRYFVFVSTERYVVPFRSIQVTHVGAHFYLEDGTEKTFVRSARPAKAVGAIASNPDILHSLGFKIDPERGLLSDHTKGGVTCSVEELVVDFVAYLSECRAAITWAPNARLVLVTFGDPNGEPDGQGTPGFFDLLLHELRKTCLEDVFSADVAECCDLYRMAVAKKMFNHKKVALAYTELTGAECPLDKGDFFACDVTASMMTLMVKSDPKMEQDLRTHALLRAYPLNERAANCERLLTPKNNKIKRTEHIILRRDWDLELRQQLKFGHFEKVDGISSKEARQRKVKVVYLDPEEDRIVAVRNEDSPSPAESDYDEETGTFCKKKKRSRRRRRKKKDFEVIEVGDSEKEDASAEAGDDDDVQLVGEVKGSKAAAGQSGDESDWSEVSIRVPDSAGSSPRSRSSSSASMETGDWMGATEKFLDRITEAGLCNCSVPYLLNGNRSYLPPAWCERCPFYKVQFVSSSSQRDPNRRRQAKDGLMLCKVNWGSTPPPDASDGEVPRVKFFSGMAGVTSCVAEVVDKCFIVIPEVKKGMNYKLKPTDFFGRCQLLKDLDSSLPSSGSCRMSHKAFVGAPTYLNEVGSFHLDVKMTSSVSCYRMGHLQEVAWRPFPDVETADPLAFVCLPTRGGGTTTLAMLTRSLAVTSLLRIADLHVLTFRCVDMSLGVQYLRGKSGDELPSSAGEVAKYLLDSEKFLHSKPSVVSDLHDLYSRARDADRRFSLYEAEALPEYPDPSKLKKLSQEMNRKSLRPPPDRSRDCPYACMRDASRRDLCATCGQLLVAAAHDFRLEPGQSRSLLCRIWGPIQTPADHLMLFPAMAELGDLDRISKVLRLRETRRWYCAVTFTVREDAGESRMMPAGTVLAAGVFKRLAGEEDEVEEGSSYAIKVARNVELPPGANKEAFVVPVAAGVSHCAVSIVFHQKLNLRLCAKSVPYVESRKMTRVVVKNESDKPVSLNKGQEVGRADSVDNCTVLSRLLTTKICDNMKKGCLSGRSFRRKLVSERLAQVKPGGQMIKLTARLDPPLPKCLISEDGKESFHRVEECRLEGPDGEPLSADLAEKMTVTSMLHLGRSQESVYELKVTLKNDNAKGTQPFVLQPGEAFGSVLVMETVRDAMPECDGMRAVSQSPVAVRLLRLEGHADVEVAPGRYFELTCTLRWSPTAVKGTRVDAWLRWDKDLKVLSHGGRKSGECVPLGTTPLPFQKVTFFVENSSPRTIAKEELVCVGYVRVCCFVSKATAAEQREAPAVEEAVGEDAAVSEMFWEDRLQHQLKRTSGKKRKRTKKGSSTGKAKAMKDGATS